MKVVRWLLLTLWLMGTGGAEARSLSPEGFSRYGVILERAPFGRTPETPEPSTPVTPADSFTSYIRLTAMVQGKDGVIRLGFVNKREGDQTFVVAVGERVDDFEVLDADLEFELARVRKGNEVQWLSLRSAGPAQPPPNWAEGRLPSAAPSTPSPSSLSSSPVNVPLPLDRRQSRYAAIRRAQLDREREAEERRREAQRAELLRPPPPDDEEDTEEDAAALALQIAQANQALEAADDEEKDDSETIDVPVLPPDDDEEDAAEEEDEETALREAEIQAHLQRYQMELIRQGLPPLPVRLTPENDEALVREGVLPPLPEAPTEGDETDEEE